MPKIRHVLPNFQRLDDIQRVPLSFSRFAFSCRSPAFFVNSKKSTPLRRSAFVLTSDKETSQIPEVTPYTAAQLAFLLEKMQIEKVVV